MAGVAPTALHAGDSALAVPHAVVLSVAVLGIWVVVGGGVLAAEAVLDRLSARRS